MTNDGVQLAPKNHSPFLVLLLVREHPFDEAREVVDFFLLARSTESFKENTRDPVNAPQPGEGLCRHRDAEIIRFRHFYITDPPGSDHNTLGAMILLCHGVGSRD